MHVNGVFFKPEELDPIKLSTSSQLQQFNGMIIQQLVQWMKFYKIKSINMSIVSVGVAISPEITYIELGSKDIDEPEEIKKSKTFLLRNIISNLMMMGGIKSISLDIDSASIEDVNKIWERMIRVTMLPPLTEYTKNID